MENISEGINSSLGNTEKCLSDLGNRITEIKPEKAKKNSLEHSKGPLRQYQVYQHSHYIGYTGWPLYKAK